MNIRSVKNNEYALVGMGLEKKNRGRMLFEVK